MCAIHLSTIALFMRIKCKIYVYVFVATVFFSSLTNTQTNVVWHFRCLSKHNRHSQYRKCWCVSFNDIRPLCGGNSVFDLLFSMGPSQATHVRTHGVTSNLLVGLIPPPPLPLSAHRHTYARSSESERERATKTDRAHRICQEKNTH